MAKSTDRLHCTIFIPAGKRSEYLENYILDPNSHAFQKVEGGYLHTHSTFCREILGGNICYKNQLLGTLQNWTMSIYLPKSDITSIEDGKAIVMKLRKFLNTSSGIEIGMEEIEYGSSTRVVPYFRFSAEKTGRAPGYEVSFIALLLENKDFVSALMGAGSRVEFCQGIIKLKSITNITRANLLLVALYVLGRSNGECYLDGLSGPSRTAEYFTEADTWKEFFGLCSERDRQTLFDASYRAKAQYLLSKELN